MGAVKTPEIDLSVVDRIIERRGTTADKVIPILQDIQASYGYLPLPALQYLAEKTDITPSQIYGVVTFYAQFRMTPMGKHIIRVCHGTACHVQGAVRVSQAVSDFLGVKDGETTEDGLFTLETVACLGCCSLAPVMMIDSTAYGQLTQAKVKKILTQYIEREKAE